MKQYLFAATLIAWPVAGCNTSDDLSDFANAFEEALREGYDFSTPCTGEAEAAACDACCITEGFDSNIVINDECGCTYVITDAEVCAGSADFDACIDCCDTNNFPSAVSFSGTCECSRNSETPN